MNRHDRRTASAIQRSSGLVGPDGKPMVKPPTVMVSVPSMCDVKADFAMCFSAMLAYSLMHGVKVSVQNHKGSVIEHARNELVAQALRTSQVDYVMQTDSDLIFPPTSLVQLLSHQKDFVGAFYNRRKEPYPTLGHLLGPARDLSTGGLHEADYMPGGMTLIKTDVFRKTKWPWYYQTYYRNMHGMSSREALFESLNDHYLGSVPAAIRAQLEANYELMQWVEEADRKPEGSGPEDMIGEDYNFSRKARRAGFKIWCDIDLTWQIGHIGEHVVTCAKAEPAKMEAAA